jgi:hypothetical protein
MRERKPSALGDETELADQLWRANRRRIRVRAAGVWAARLLLPPVAVALIVYLGANSVAGWAMMARQSRVRPPQASQIESAYRERVLSRVPAEMRPLFEYDPVAAKRAAAAHPDDPALYANYAITTLVPPLYNKEGSYHGLWRPMSRTS